jgi:hypothetical protein
MVAAATQIRRYETFFPSGTTMRDAQKLRHCDNNVSEENCFSIESGNSATGTDVVFNEGSFPNVSRHQSIPVSRR